MEMNFVIILAGLQIRYSGMRIINPHQLQIRISYKSITANPSHICLHYKLKKPSTSYPVDGFGKKIFRF